MFFIMLLLSQTTDVEGSNASPNGISAASNSRPENHGNTAVGISSGCL
jgi:hypothetical protein